MVRGDPGHRRWRPLAWLGPTLGTGIPHPESRGRRALIHGTAVLALVLGSAYLTWRAIFTLNLTAWWISVPLLALELHAFLALGLFTFSLWDVDALVPAAPVERTSKRLAVLVPTLNESTATLLPTVAAAVAMRLPHETWVLDDGDRPEVRQLATEVGARYLTRPVHDNAKAGNLNHALAVIDADVVAIFDADHVADANFLVDTLGYFDDPSVAVVQTPQDFYNTNSFEHLGHESPFDNQTLHEETLFYREIQPGKNRWKAPFWCGTNAAIRVSALRDIGGVPTETVTEDIHSSVRLHERGWKIVYHNEVLARGLAASDAAQFTKQRHRWATGAMQLLRVENPFTKRSLRVRQRVAYASTILGWFDAWRSLGFLLIPPVVLFTGASPISVSLAVFIVAFGVTFFVEQFALVLLSRGYHRPFAGTRFELTRLFSTLSATLTLFTGRARGFQVTAKGRTGNERERMPVPWGLRALLILSAAAAVWFGLTEAGLTPLHYGTPGVVWGALGWLLLNTWILVSAVRWIRSRAHGTELRRSVRFKLDRSGSFDGRRCTVHDCSLTGASVELDASAPPASLIDGNHRLEIPFGETTVRLAVSVAASRGGGGAGLQLGVEFADGEIGARAALARNLFRSVPAPSFPEREALRAS